MSKAAGAAIIGVGAVLASSGALGAVTYFGPGSGGSVAKWSAGTAGTLQTSIVLTDSSSVTGVSVLLTSLVHAWLGELSATLTHVPTGRTASLFDRIGYSLGTPSGDSTDFVGHYTFEDGGANLVTLAIQLGGSTAIPSATYGATGAGGTPVSLATTFAGVSAAGEWRLTMRNHGTSDTGSLGSWKVGLDLAPLPTPGTAVIGLAGAGIAGVRRRRQG